MNLRHHLSVVAEYIAITLTLLSFAAALILSIIAIWIALSL